MPLKAFFLNSTLKASPEASNTRALMDVVVGFMKAFEPDIEIGVERATDYNIAYGIMNDMGGDDEWSTILQKIQECDIFVLGMPIWMGVRSSVCQQIIERLDGTTKVVPEGPFGQFQLYNKVAGVVITGNEDGAHDCAATTLFNLAHFGFTVPPNTDCYWVGDAGPGPSFSEAGGSRHPYTIRNAKLTALNLIHAAKMLANNPYTVNIKELNMEMMAANQRIWAAQSELRQSLLADATTQE